MTKLSVDQSNSSIMSLLLVAERYLMIYIFAARVLGYRAD